MRSPFKMTMSPATRLHLVIAGAYVLLFATYAIIIWRSWLTVPKVRVAAVVPNEADAVVVGLFSAGASSASSASAASDAANFHDVVTGDNRGSVGGNAARLSTYFEGTGYQLPTGLGSPHCASLCADLLAL